MIGEDWDMVQHEEWDAFVAQHWHARPAEIGHVRCNRSADVIAVEAVPGGEVGALIRMGRAGITANNADAYNMYITTYLTREDAVRLIAMLHQAIETL